MKSLNEVITVMDHVEFCCTNCKLQFDCDEVECFLEDALHYLKKYQKVDSNWSEKAISELHNIGDAYFLQLRKYRDKVHSLDIDIANHCRSFEQLGVEIARYQEAKAEMEEISADYVALKQWWAEQQENPPLSWDELKQMQGKPVWVEDNIDTPEDITKYWAIMWRIEKVECDEYALLSDFYYQKSQYGKDWQAYRKERE